MTNWTRREWTKAVLGGLVAAVPAAARAGSKKPPARVDARIGGVAVGVLSASFGERTLDEALQSMKAIGVGYCELSSSHVEPKALTGAQNSREQLRRWRMSTPLEEFAVIRTKLDAAGITLVGYQVDLRSDFTDAELERTFVVASMLGAPRITTASTVSMIPRSAYFAREHRVQMALLNSAEATPDTLATPDELAHALSGAPPEIGIALDLGAFAAAGHDAIAFLKQHWRRTFVVHLSDRKRDQGKSVAWGEGDAPIAAVLRLVRDGRWPLPAVVDYAYAGRDAIDEVKRCLAFCREALAASRSGIDTSRSGA
jgi:sugar phosphate isomerase/epimerase